LRTDLEQRNIQPTRRNSPTIALETSLSYAGKPEYVFGLNMRSRPSMPQPQPCCLKCAVRSEARRHPLVGPAAPPSGRTRRWPWLVELFTEGTPRTGASDTTPCYHLIVDEASTTP
jgi:hypothetical protein